MILLYRLRRRDASNHYFKMRNLNAHYVLQIIEIHFEKPPADPFKPYILLPEG